MSAATAERIYVNSGDQSQANSMHLTVYALGYTNAILPEALDGIAITRIVYADVQPVIPLRGEDYPSLVRVWDNDADAIYDTI